MKIFKILFVSVSIILLSSCGSRNEETKDKLTAVSTITIINDMVKQVAGDKVEAVSICGVGYDPHTYKSVPADSRTIARSDIVFMNDLGLEGWIKKLIEAAGGERPVITVTEGIDPLTDPTGYGDYDPHCWFDAQLAKVYVQNILKGLIRIDPENEDYYKANAERYLKELDELDSWTKEMINSIPDEHKILVTSHDAFRYFGEAYGMRVEGLQGISTEAKVQTADVARLVDLINSIKLPAVFIETSVNPKLLEQIALETSAVIGGTLYSDSIGDEGTSGGSFIGAFKHNVETITGALKGKKVSELKL
jgi:ABC-type Zn uptake system ZnuABC Zn-binding protein ZnuA